MPACVLSAKTCTSHLQRLTKNPIHLLLFSCSTGISRFVQARTTGESKRCWKMTRAQCLERVVFGQHSLNYQVLPSSVLPHPCNLFWLCNLAGIVRASWVEEVSVVMGGFLDRRG